jgi:hypothetical protein
MVAVFLDSGLRRNDENPKIFLKLSAIQLRPLMQPAAASGCTAGATKQRPGVKPHLDAAIRDEIVYSRKYS